MVYIYTDKSNYKILDELLLKNGYQATVDHPGTCFYQELMELYPNAKVILSLRDDESYYKSIMNTIYGLDIILRQRNLMKLIGKFMFDKDLG